MTRRDASARAVEALRASAPELDDLRRARMERRLLEAAAKRAGAPAAGSERPRRERGGRIAWAAGGALAAAAALALAWVVGPTVLGGGELAPVARFEMGGASGTLDVGGTLEVGRGERAEVRVGGVELALGGESAMRFGSLDVRDVRVQLTSGRVEVAFHPRERGRERLSIETPSARVEVVGTVFTVQLEGEATRVSVREGAVRVVPRAAAESAVLVHAGESVRIDGRARAASDELAAAASAAPPPEVEAALPTAEEEAESAELAAVEVAPAARGSRRRARAAELAPVVTVTPRPAPAAAVELDELPDTSVARPVVQPVSPRQRLGAARRVLDSGDHRRARSLLRELTRAQDATLDVRVEAWSLLGDSLYASDARQAAEAYERAATLGRGRPEGHVAIYALARTQERGLRDREAARATYLRYLREAPHGANAELARRAVCRLGGDAAVQCAEGEGGAR